MPVLHIGDTSLTIAGVDVDATMKSLRAAAGEPARWSKPIKTEEDSVRVLMWPGAPIFITVPHQSDDYSVTDSVF